MHQPALSRSPNGIAGRHRRGPPRSARLARSAWTGCDRTRSWRCRCARRESAVRNRARNAPLGHAFAQHTSAAASFVGRMGSCCRHVRETHPRSPVTSRRSVSELISPDVRRFVAESIGSVAQLELLLILRRDPAVEWESAGREMRFPADWVAAQLVGFHRAGLVGSSGREQRTYRYGPRPGLGRIVDKLAEMFSRRPTAVISLIYTRAADARAASPTRSDWDGTTSRWQPSSISCVH